MSEPITLQINGRSHRFSINPETPLLYVLRNELGLNGPKYGCGIARCGSCMVLVNGVAQPSCILPAAAAVNQEITTLEALGNAENLHPLQRAFMQEQAAQCGYCLNGMLISAKALLDKNKSPSDTDIKKALEPVLCRCGTHTRFIRAVKRAANELKLN